MLSAPYCRIMKKANSDYSSREHLMERVRSVISTFIVFQSWLQESRLSAQRPSDAQAVFRHHHGSPLLKGFLVTRIQSRRVCIIEDLSNRRPHLGHVARESVSCG